MAADFLKIAITPDRIADPRSEALHIAGLLEREVDFVHLRYPTENEDLILQMISMIPLDMRWRLSIHDHHDRVIGSRKNGESIVTGSQFSAIGGVHFNARNPFSKHAVYSGLRLSTSCHSIQEIKEITDYKPSYVTLSPIFDSISKPGYMSAFSLKELNEELKGIKIPVIALGGVTPDKIASLKEAGFRGAAMLAYYDRLFRD